MTDFSYNEGDDVEIEVSYYSYDLDGEPVSVEVFDESGNCVYSDIVEFEDFGESYVTVKGESQAPELVRRCFDSIRKHCSNELVVLDEDSLRIWFLGLALAVWE